MILKNSCILVKKNTWRFSCLLRLNNYLKECYVDIILHHWTSGIENKFTKTFATILTQHCKYEIKDKCVTQQ